MCSECTVRKKLVDPVYLAVWTSVWPVQCELKGFFHAPNVLLWSMPWMESQRHSPFVHIDEECWEAQRHNLSLDFPKLLQFVARDLARQIAIDRCTCPAVDNGVLELEPFCSCSQPARRRDHGQERLKLLGLRIEQGCILQ